MRQGSSSAKWSPMKKAIRLFNKLNLVRVPLRLGFDVLKQPWSPKNALDDFANHEGVQTPHECLRCYTPQSLRHQCHAGCKNAQDIIRKIKLETDIAIEIIGGDLEANHLWKPCAENMDRDHSYLYIDVGGKLMELFFLQQRYSHL